MKIIIAGQTHEVKAQKGHTVLDAAIVADLNPPYSCMEGVCQACAARIVSADKTAFKEAQTDEPGGHSHLSGAY